MSNVFADHFSSMAQGYASYRPQYPPSLFAYLADLTAGRALAWDCAAGSGQATRGLVPWFESIVATDASAAQLAGAPPHPKITYRVATAENSGLANASVNLVTVAQAAHWFDLERFYAELRRVVVAEGVVALWCYGLHRIAPAVDEVMNAFYTNVIGPYWPAERALIEAGYRTIPFPFDEVTPPAFEMTARWTLPQLLGYLRTWSAVERYRAANGDDPVTALGAQLAAPWGNAATARDVRWPLAMRVGRVR